MPCPATFIRGHVTISGNIFGCSNWRLGGGGCYCIQWVEAKDAVNYPTMPRTAPHTNNFLAQSVNSGKIEDHCCREADVFISTGMFSSLLNLQVTWTSIDLQSTSNNCAETDGMIEQWASFSCLGLSFTFSWFHNSFSDVLGIVKS